MKKLNFNDLTCEVTLAGQSVKLEPRLYKHLRESMRGIKVKDRFPMYLLQNNSKCNKLIEPLGIKIMKVGKKKMKNLSYILNSI